MKLLTHSFLTCAVKSCRSSPSSYPLHFKDCSLEKTELAFQPLFIRNILPRIDWEALQTSCAELGLSALLPEQNPTDAVLESDHRHNDATEAAAGETRDIDDETLRKMHTLLMEMAVVEGKLVCANCGFEYPIKEGVGNFLLPPHLV